MNDDSSSSRTAAGGNPIAPSDGLEQQETAGSAAARKNDAHTKTQKFFRRKRIEFLDDLLNNLDLLVYAELSIIYYMEYVPYHFHDEMRRAPLFSDIDHSCSFFKFVLRSILQLFYLTPKPEQFPDPPLNRPYLGIIIGGNALAALFHVWSHAPSAGEATRGYLHGGLAMDFIGQKGPSSKVVLVLLDILVAILQLLQLAVLLTVQKIKTRGEPATSSAEVTQASTNAQDLDSEERGIQRAHHQNDDELLALNSRGQHDESASSFAHDEDEEHESMLDDTIARSDEHIRDAFHSGQIILANFSLSQLVGHQLSVDNTATPESIETARQMRANLANQLLRLRLGGSSGRAADG